MIDKPVKLPEDVIRKLIKLRNKLMASSPLPPFYPRGTKVFLKVVRPEESGDVFAGTLFPIPLSPEDEKEARALCKEYGISFS
jgi:hypothetical protein